jgi:hypothetical protein
MDVVVSTLVSTCPPGLTEEAMERTKPDMEAVRTKERHLKEVIVRRIRALLPQKRRHFADRANASIFFLTPQDRDVMVQIMPHTETQGSRPEIKARSAKVVDTLPASCRRKTPLRASDVAVANAGNRWLDYDPQVGVIHKTRALVTVQLAPTPSHTLTTPAAAP